ncbi:MAG TPA: cytochrome c biogenesis protein CcsA [Candidatus Acidoferrales bacterium]|nr:cytochrome c biogenesis protein CcsA [Candidatus Acidoferrales bacterium]
MKRAFAPAAFALLAPALLGAAGPGPNPGQWLSWLALLASVTSAFGWLLAANGRTQAIPLARAAFRVQWLAFLGAAFFLWWILFHHQFQYQYVHDYSSRSMPRRFVYAAFWGGQEGTFLLWGLLTATLGLVLMRWKSPTQPTAMLFMNLPIVMLALVTVMRGPFLASREAYTDGVGLNPLLQDYWMTIHPPVLFTGFSSFVVPFAIACAALWRRDYDGWVKAALPWVVFSAAIQATGFIMGGVWAYKVLGWGGYWGWDPVENGSLIPWLSNIALLHGLLVQRVTGSLRRTNFFLAITSYVLVLYASFLTRSGVLADFSVHSFANLGLSGFLLSFVAIAALAGYGLLVTRLVQKDIPSPAEPLGTFSRESFMWLGQLVFMLMCLLVTLGMSAPLLTRLFGPPANVQTGYYNLVNAPLAIALGLLLGISPLLRWRKHDVPERRPAIRGALGLAGLAIGLLFAGAFLLSWLHRIPAGWITLFGVGLMVWLLAAIVLYVPIATVAVGGGLAITFVAIALGVRDAMPASVLFAMAFALVANFGATVRGFRAGWRHGIAFLGHMGVSVMLIGVIASSGYGHSAQVQLPRGEPRNALGYRLTFQGLQHEPNGKDQAVIAVAGPDRNFTARARFFWSDYNQGWMKNPHIERFATKDLYISPLEMVGQSDDAGVWFAPGETKQVGQVKYTFESFLPEPGEGRMKLTANVTAEVGGRTVPLKPVFEVDMAAGRQTRIPATLPGGGEVGIVTADPNTGRVELSLPGQQAAQEQILAVEVSSKPFINLVWVGAILMLASAFLVVVRRAQELARA